MEPRIELRTKLTPDENAQLAELGQGILSDGLRVALGMAETVRQFWPSLYEAHIRQAQVLRTAHERDRARAAAATRWGKKTNETAA